MCKLIIDSINGGYQIIDGPDESAVNFEFNLLDEMNKSQLSFETIDEIALLVSGGNGKYVVIYFDASPDEFYTL